MQHTVVMSGIGGQGIVVGTTLLGHAATKNGDFAMHYAQYGGEMRGTKCECTLAISGEPVTAPPLVSEPDVAIIMHPNPPTKLHGTAAESFQAITANVRPGGLAIVNSSLLVSAEELNFRDDIEWLLIPMTDIAKDLGHLMIATMVAISAFACETNLVPVGYIRNALPDVIPAYRHKLLEMDDAGLNAGQMLLESKIDTVGRTTRGKALVDVAAINARRTGARIESTVPYIFRGIAVAG